MQLLKKTTNTSFDLDKCSRELLTAVPSVMRFIRQQMRQHRQAELTVPQLRTLIFLSHHDGTTLSKLAEHLGLSTPAVSRMVETLVKRGLILRKEGTNDRRSILLSLTPKGKKVFETAHNATRVAVAHMLQKLSTKELARISWALRILSDLFAPENTCINSGK
jgi:DNA-binding MarR family transcriptional regulator